MFERNQTNANSTSPDFQGQVREIRVDDLFPMKNQPRQRFQDETLEELAASIRSYGVLQPLLVSEAKPGQYYIIAGERRWRASKLAGMESVPCIVRKKDPSSELEIALIENIQREELSAVDEARALQKLMEDHNYTQEALASKIGKDRTTVTNALRILSLPQEILDDLQQKKMTAGHARALCALDSRSEQLDVRDTILSKKLSVRQTEELIKKVKQGKQEAKMAKDTIPADLRQLCDQFKGHLGTKVKISGEASRGRIEISYYSLEDLERITELMLSGGNRNRLL